VRICATRRQIHAALRRLNKAAAEERARGRVDAFCLVVVELVEAAMVTGA